MQRRKFGATGLSVSIIGFGAGHIGAPAQDEREVERLLHAALDLGINLIDTARGYGLSEERIARSLASRRDEFVLSSKCGYDVPGRTNWTGACVAAGIDAALNRLRTDRIDIMHLHSCPREVLERGEVIAALDDAVQAGKVRVAAYSGENDALAFALTCDVFRSVQLSINVCDQRAIRDALPVAAARKLGVIAKRPLANAFWRFRDRPTGEYCEEYWLRAKAMQLSPAPLDWDEFALRFAAHQSGVHTCIVGTSHLERLRRNVELARRGPLPADLVQRALDAFRAHDDDWIGQV